MKKNNHLMLITSAVCLIPFIIGAVFYKQMPEQVAIHFNSSGQPDGYASKLFALFGLPTILLIINLMTHLAIKEDAESGKASKVTVLLAKWTIPMVALFGEIITIAFALGKNFNINTYVYLFVGIITMILGNYLPKCQQNTTIGVKTPWTLKDKDNWKKTHRISGYTWIICGFILGVNAFVNVQILNMIAILMLILIPFGYSFMIYKKR